MKHLIIFLLLSSFVTLWAKALDGKWVTSESGARVYLEFISKNHLIYDGENLEYRVNKNVIEIPDPYFGYVAYPYRFKNKKLLITFPEGYTLSFVKVKKTSKKERQTAQGGASQNYLLQGRLCSYSSSYNGGYSHSDMLYFDGRGNYSTRAQTYSSGSSGAYVNENDGSSGRYRVEGGVLYVQTDDGRSFQGKIIEQKSDGRITGIDVNGNVFAAGLCD